MGIRAVLLDIDGVLFTGTEPIPGASEALLSLQKREIPYRFISNGTRKNRVRVLDRLSRLAVPLTEDLIITPAIAAIEYLKENGYTSCTLLTTDELRQDFIAAGITVTDDAPVLVVGDAWNGFTYESVNRAFRHVMGGASLIALEKDRFWKDGGSLSLGAGAFVAGLEYASGKEALLMGKPSSAFFEMALHQLGVEPGETLMVGDDIVSDIGGARGCGINGVLVMTGKCSREILEASSIRPDWVLPSVADLPALLDHV